MLEEPNGNESYMRDVLMDIASSLWLIFVWDRVTSLADALRLDFALIHKDRARAGPQGHNRPYSGMPKMNGAVRVSEEDEDSVVNGEGSNTASEDMMMASISSLNEAGMNGDVMNAAVSIVANNDGEESTITLVGDVKNKPVFLTVSSHCYTVSS